MSLDNTNIIDAVGLEKDTGYVVLTIADSWDWSAEYEHLVALQNKINSYFAFITSGQLLQDYPKASGRKVKLDIVVRYPLSQAAIEFVAKAPSVAAGIGVELSSRLVTDQALGQ